MRPPYAVLLASRVSDSFHEALRGARSTGISLVVVDDGSPDDVAKAASRAGVEAIRHPAPFGRAQALLSGVHYAIREESPGAILVARADRPDLPLVLPALARAIREDPGAVVVALSPGLLPDIGAAVSGLWRWWLRDDGPPYALSIDLVRELSLGISNRGPELTFLQRAARGALSLKACYV